MEMIVVCGVVVRAQYTIEEPARAGSYFSQERRLFAGLRPVFQHTNSLTVFQDEACDVQSFGGGVLTASGVRPAVDVATGVAAEVLDGGDPLPKVFFRCRAEHVMLPHRQRHCRPTAQ